MKPKKGQYIVSSQEEKESYQEGFEDGLKYAEKGNIPLIDVTESIDKFLDKINRLKFLLRIFYSQVKEKNIILFDNEEEQQKLIQETEKEIERK